jgi:ATP-dependent RNA helicase DDX31/DBP7
MQLNLSYDAPVAKKKRHAAREVPPAAPAADGAVASTSAFSASAVELGPNSALADADSPHRSFGTRKNPVQLPEDEERHRDPADANHVPLPSSTSDHIFSQDASFGSLKLNKRLVDVLTAPWDEGGMGHSRPTIVQQKAVPLALGGRDVMVKSETGSGKTLTYLLPILNQLQGAVPRVERSDGTMALILAPTRELCLQILEVLQRVVQPFIWLVPGMITGGEQRKREKARLRKGVTVLVATPGRLLDHLTNTQCFRFDQLRWLVIDECDRLMDGGFQEQMTAIFELLCKTKNSPGMAKARYTGNKDAYLAQRQTMLLSATIDERVKSFAGISMKDPAFIDAGEGAAADADLAADAARASAPAGMESGEEALVGDDTQATYATPVQLQQHYMVVPCKLRLPVLVGFLRSTFAKSLKCKIVVFMSSCDSVDFHHALFTHKDREDLFGRGRVADVSRLHGGLSQSARRDAFRQFVRATTGVLLCTDVAARGLDLPAVDWIVQFDAPQETRDYVHRVGRTARRGQEGSSLLFLMPSETGYLRHLQKFELMLHALGMEAMLESLASTEDFGKEIRTAEYGARLLPARLQKLMQTLVSGDSKLEAWAAAAFKSAVRAYAAHSKDHKKFFVVRQLHFGHFAKSFGLKAPPKVVGSSEVTKRGQQSSGIKRKGQAGSLSFSSASGAREPKLKQHRVRDEFAA